MLHSLQAFVKDASSFSHEAVDKLLDALTEGAHSKYLKVMAEKERIEEEKQVKVGESAEKTTKVAAAENESGQDSAKKPAATVVSAANTKVSSTTPASANTSPVDVAKIDFQSLLSLADEGIDVSFLRPDETPSGDSMSSLLSHDLQVKLESTGKLLDDLQEAQNIRLSHRPEGPGGPTPGASIRPSAQEKIIGENFGITA
ncbi:PREDICTED: uncharacterized protein LOC107356464 isoform X2 [Acropora digitifera]|uniref:uncharacterized protein LOC107356464 isoform X2 n=1 Tax=Acropora digitifera TaxID=70779 RepID=UPI00077A85C5|nr:PREDICTED: uncharacterized protein LOC107356464 isoform X2 [Acropora digitifera]